MIIWMFVIRIYKIWSNIFIDIVDECVSFLCIYGNCFNEYFYYECICEVGYMGVNCELGKGIFKLILVNKLWIRLKCIFKYYWKR